MTDPVTCMACGKSDPPPEMTCDAGEPDAAALRDHYVGTDAGCPDCGRLIAACAARPCTPEGEEGGGDA